MKNAGLKSCLAVIAVTLAAVTYFEVMDNPASNGGPDPLPSDPGCVRSLAEQNAMLAALEDQLKQVPAFIQEKDDDGNSTTRKPNALYEQLMRQVNSVKASIDRLESQCGA